VRFPNIRISGPLTDLLPELEFELLRQGYTPLSCRNLLYLASHLSRWLQEQGLGLCDLSDGQIDSFFCARRAEGYTQFLIPSTLTPIRRVLTEAGLVPAPEPKPAPLLTPLERLLSEYEGSLVHDRGLTPAVAGRYRIEAQQLLVKASPSGLDFSSLDGATVKGYVLERSQGGSVEQTRAMLTGLRSFLRFLLLRGDIAEDLRGAVPKIAGRRMASLPKYLASEQVNAIVGSCDRRSTLGRRDYAVLLLLARMGLRAKEVAALSLDDLDWYEGILLVHGKGGREDRMPLPAEVGKALASYLRRRRKTTWRALFLGHYYPHGPLGSGAIITIVRKACKRAHIPPVGAHRLRHSAATTMLRRGATLEEISQVLRHRSHATTAIYAKVDHRRLRELAQPWPGGAA
jgi:site-specific recombinase XerD